MCAKPAHTMQQPSLSPSDIFALVVGASTLVAVAFGRLPAGLTMSRAVLALAGACVLIAGGAIDLGDAIASIDGEVLVLLFGLLAVNAALASAGAFRYLAAWAGRRNTSPHALLVVVVAVSGLLSALFLNDTVVLMLTPVVARLALNLGLPPVPYLLALALAANAGSVATITGNPQNVAVAIAHDIGYGRFLVALGPVAVMALFVIVLVVSVAYRRELRTVVPVTPAAASPQSLAPSGLPRLERGQLLVALVVVSGMLVAFAVGVPVAKAALLAGCILLVSRGPASRGLLRQLDFSLLVLFASLFVVVGAMAATGAPQRWLLGALGGGGVLDVVWVTALLSTIISNVPAVLILLPVAPADAGLAIAMAATLAGNLTLVASVANLIVAESARRVGVEVGFWAYARVGIPVTVASLAIGTVWLLLTAG